MALAFGKYQELLYQNNRYEANLSLKTSHEHVVRGNCESTDPPMIDSNTLTPQTDNCTWARSTDLLSHGASSYKLTKTSAAAAGTAAAYLHDTTDTTNMRGFHQGRAFTYTADVYAPPGTTPAHIILRFQWYNGAAWQSFDSETLSANEVWETLSLTNIIPASATGVRCYLRLDTAADLNDIVYGDNFSIIDPVPVKTGEFINDTQWHIGPFGKIVALNTCDIAWYADGEARDTNGNVAAGTEISGNITAVQLQGAANRAMAYSVRNKGICDNIIDRGNCETSVPPALRGGLTNTLSNATLGFDSTVAYSGAYSYKFTKTIAAGTLGAVFLQDNINTTDMHGLVAGETYVFSAWVYIPSGGILGSEVEIGLDDYQGAWAGTDQSAANVYDQWQLISKYRTIRSAATGARIDFETLAAAALNEYFYIDDLRCVKVT